MEVKQIGNIMPGTNRENPNQGRVYDSAGLSPTISSMQGGGRQPMTVDIKQATKEGFIPCEVGGGGGSELSRQPNKARPSAREWSDMPDSDNGEYP